MTKRVWLPEIRDAEADRLTDAYSLTFFLISIFSRLIF